ncbi:hypothetical protein O1W71_01985 [Microbacterium sp. H37-C3]|uniref:hypothetical protein n=1 Tax=Microbacterium sp. H37-C3 TaxID=3004354 RepID=UPI0022B06B09|nr:hypothetical protein [Microbacterium sp. H37-C3]MCZ4066438.1 hypothetical protein [Microbacterium sp. H37-C3]
MEPDLAATRALVRTAAAQQATLADLLVRALLALWFPFLWPGRPDMVNALAARSAVIVDVAHAQARRRQRAVMLAQLRALDAIPRTLPPVEDLYPRSDVPIVEVYKRPARAYEQAIRTGKTPEEAEQVMRTRLETIAETDLAAAIRDEAKRTFKAAPKVVGFRRVIHPEMSKTGTCGLCIVAADRFYTVEDLLELHDGCHCTVAPITSDADPGLRLNRDDLDALYAAAGSTFADDLKRIRVTSVEHGELGPILIRDGDSFRGVDAVNRATKRGRKTTPYSEPTKQSNAWSWESNRRSSEKAIETLEAARAAGTNLVDLSGSGRPTAVRDLDVAIAYHRSLISRADAHLAAA